MHVHPSPAHLQPEFLLSTTLSAEGSVCEGTELVESCYLAGTSYTGRSLHLSAVQREEDVTVPDKSEDCVAGIVYFSLAEKLIKSNLGEKGFICLISYGLSSREDMAGT